MKWVLVYKGKGMYEDDTAIFLRVMKEHVDTTIHQLDTISAMDIIKGRLAKDTALLVIGGGYDLGLIEALEPQGITNIKNFVEAGGSYLGICSGAYFACDRIEFDKGGSLEVLGERYLKFYPGAGIGPLFKPYDYKSRHGASVVSVDFHQHKATSNQLNYSDARELQECSNKLKESRKKDLCHDAGSNFKFAIENHCLGGIDQETASSIYEVGAVSSYDRLEKFESQGLVQGIKSQILQVESQGQETYVESQNSGLNLKSHSQTCLKESHLTVTAYNELSKPLEVQEHCEKKQLKNDSMEDCDGNDTCTFSCKVYFNGGCYFRTNDQDNCDSVRVLSCYFDLADRPAAIVQCQSGAGMAVLSGVHLEYDAQDIDDGDIMVTDIVPCLRNSAKERKLMLKCILQQLNITVK